MRLCLGCLLILRGSGHLDYGSNGSNNAMERMTHGSTLSLDCGDSSVLLLPAMHGHWFELAQRKQTLIQLGLRALFWVIVAYVRRAEIDGQGKFESVNTKNHN